MNDTSRDDKPQVKPMRLFVGVWVALMVLLLVTIGSAFLDLGAFNVVVNLAVSVLSAWLLMTYFMHETPARRLTIMASALGFIWLAILVSLSLTDFLARVPVPPPW